jgi:LacI family transcriptional regulator
MPSKRTKPAKSNKRAGVLDVARASGVSVATVSRAFNLPNLVSDDVRLRILATAQKLGYAANPAAKALRSRKTHIVGVAIPTLDYSIFAKMINHFQDAFAQHGYTTIVATTGFEHANVFEKVKTLVDHGAEALLLVGAIEDPALVRYLREPHIPVVTTYSYIPEEIVPCIGFDNYAATQSAMEYLADLGHRTFAMISGNPKGSDRQRSRISAYNDFITGRKLAGATNVIIRNFTIRDGAEAIRAILEKYPDTTAVVCNTDVMAFGALSESRRLGIRIPQDISIIGFDDAEYAAQLDPPLTTIAVPAEEMGLLAAEMLHTSLTTGEPPRFVRLDSHLIVRKSACPPRAMKQIRAAVAAV